MTEVRTQRFYGLASVQEHRCVEVPQRVHAVLAGGLVAFAGPPVRQDAGLSQRELPATGVEVRAPERPAATGASKHQLLGDERAVRSRPRQCHGCGRELFSVPRFAWEYESEVPDSTGEEDMQM
ncbi:hypothetical protein AB0393_02280 [Streptomyces cyaneofuscatus]|uniref:hypothetical protein n=1 Tax=Streptomyces TaxID=1883 RepID=UPI0034508DFA